MSSVDEGVHRRHRLPTSFLPPLRPALSAIAAVAAAVTVACLAWAPASAVTAIDLTPGSVPRGADVAVPHLEGLTVVDGSLRVPVAAPVVQLLGRSGAAYVVATGDEQGSHGRILRIQADGSRTLLTRAGVYQTVLSDDGGRIAAYRVAGHDHTVISVWSSVSGELVARRTFHGFVDILDARGGRLLLGSFDPGRTMLWTTGPDRVQTIYRQAGYAADLSTGLLARFTGDPFAGGCTEVTRLGSDDVLWRSCGERVDSFSTDGSRMATIDKLSDGIGPSRVTARLVTGQAVGRYDVPNGWFGTTSFESPTALLLPTSGKRRTAVLRCVDSTCERASDLSPTIAPRTGEVRRARP